MYTCMSVACVVSIYVYTCIVHVHVHFICTCIAIATVQLIIFSEKQQLHGIAI